MRWQDVTLTAWAPMIWGTTYLVTGLWLPVGVPLTIACLRALPAGLLLLLWVRRLPVGRWWGKVFVLGALNFSLFWTLLFVSAYRLPGGVAATVTAVQPLAVVLLSRLILRTPLRRQMVFAAMVGVGGVALLVLTPAARLDPWGIAAGGGAALSMACGTVLSRHWQPPVPALTFTAWQLTAGGLLLVPIAWWSEPALPSLSWAAVGAVLWLGLAGAALSYVLWFRGLAKLEPAVVSMLGFLSPLTAVLLGGVVMGETLSGLQVGGVALVLASLWLAQRPLPNSR